MIREQMISKDIGRSGNFRWRGQEVLRIEGLSDAVFAFAITLLVVSLEVPKTFNELAETMRLWRFSDQFHDLAGMAYMLTPLVMTINGRVIGRRRKRLAQVEATRE